SKAHGEQFRTLERDTYALNYVEYFAETTYNFLSNVSCNVSPSAMLSSNVVYAVGYLREHRRHGDSKLIAYALKVSADACHRVVGHLNLSSIYFRDRQAELIDFLPSASNSISTVTEKVYQLRITYAELTKNVSCLSSIEPHIAHSICDGGESLVNIHVSELGSS